MIMPAATRPRHKRETRLLVIDAIRGTWLERQFVNLSDQLRPGDLLVLNDAATLPASLFGQTRQGRAVELRLVSPGEKGVWRAVLFGAGDWRTPTERRPAPPQLHAGDVITFNPTLSATIRRVHDEVSERLVEINFSLEGAALWSALYTHGRVIQYAYLERDLTLEETQVAYATRPWAVEMPSAGRPLDWSMLFELQKRGVQLATLTHAAGLSSTGDPAIDALLPLDERYAIPEETALAVARARLEDRRIIAVGTTVVRALESAALERGGEIHPGERSTTLHIDAAYSRRVVSGILSGMHEPDATHFTLLEAFCPRATLEGAHAASLTLGYRGHEFGDSWLILGPRPRLDTSREVRQRSRSVISKTGDIHPGRA